MKEILINSDKNNNVVTALLDKGEALEIYEQNEDSETLEGNIYCGIVRNILPGMQSAFVDINEKKNAFIHIKDILPKASSETGNKEEKFEKYDIRKYVNTNMPILVQIKKEAENKKGARVSKHISLTGKYMVLMPEVSFITVSQKIIDENDKKKLKEMVSRILKDINTEKEKIGIIIRTAAINVTEKEIEEDIRFLKNLWDNILKEYKKVKDNKKPVMLYKNENNIFKLINNTATIEETKIITNDEKIYKEVQELSSQLKNITIELKEQNLMNMYNLEKQIEKSKDRKIWLKCGGFITIDKTEALTAIDVNSGKFIGKKNNNKNETVYRVNVEATIEIAKQLRLRNISGIIVIDYIDMERDEYRQELLEIFLKELKKDRSKTQVIGFTKLDLLEMTRKKL